MSSGRWQTVSAVGCVLGCLALMGQILGAVAAAATPHDNQGSVGKAYVAIASSCLAYPLAAAGLGLCLLGRKRSEEKLLTTLGLVAGGLALLPMAFCGVFFH